jgi:ABC-2 type transport system ATP-binding protein
MIRIENLVKRYGQVRALDELNMQVEPGVVYGFLGPNGAGKTTTLRILSGLAKADGGRAWILDREVGPGAVDQRPQIGVLPEEPAFYGWMTAMEFLRDFIAPLYGIRGEEAARRSAEMLDLVDLSKAANRRLTGFSRGMRQRLGLAQALIHQPKVLLLDEPVSALDPAGRKDVLDLIDRLRSQATVLFSSHILTDVERVCDVIGIINNGRLIIQAPREDLLERYAVPLIEVETEQGFGSWLETARSLPVVESLTVDNHTARILVKDVHTEQQEILRSLVDEGLLIRRFQVITPSLEDIFLRLTESVEPQPA